MLLSLSWLREFTPFEGTAQALGDRLTMLGLELEDIRYPFEVLSHITTGHVLSCVMHPNSDHLHCCVVDVGGEAPLDIVCGAPNVAEGQKVAVATIGTRMPDGTVIKKSKLRGQPSHGMICSERELGLSENHDGIMVLSPETPVGRRLCDVLDLDSEILDLSITPNRADCLSVLGLARETAMAFSLPFSIPEITLETGQDETSVPIDITDAGRCYLYSGRVVHDITVQPSPARIRYRLQACGIRAISNIVDVTNYILLECGQPLHAFDCDLLEDRRISVRPAREGERFTTLDGQERVLSDRDLCICDGRRIVALAGVMGGLDSEITGTTRNVFVESAVFDPATIRRTSRRLGLSSESSFRFERGIDQQRTLWALDRACAMMASLSGGTADRTLNVVETRPFAPAVVPFRRDHASRLLGIPLEDSFCARVFQGTGCAYTEEKDVWQVTQPSWRPDITREADLIEEVGRVHGLDAIPPDLPPMYFRLEDAGRPQSDFVFGLDLRHWAAGLGLNEAINYSFVGQKDLDLLGLPEENRIRIKNPLSADQDVLRTTIAPGLLHTLRNNLAQGAPSVRIFELANVFEKDAASETTAKEHMQFGILLSGLRHEHAWPYTPEDMSYTDIRGIVEHLVHFLHGKDVRFEKREGHPYCLPALDVRAGDVHLGVVGRVLPKIADQFLAQKDVWIAELECSALRSLKDGATVQFTELPTYPSVRRDITVIGSPDLQVGQVRDVIDGLRNPLIREVVFISSYEPEATGEKHLSFRITFRHAGRTLKDSEVDVERNKVAEALIRALGVRI